MHIRARPAVDAASLLDILTNKASSSDDSTEENGLYFDSGSEALEWFLTIPNTQPVVWSVVGTGYSFNIEVTCGSSTSDDDDDARPR